MGLVVTEEGEGAMSAQTVSARVGTTASARGATRLLDYAQGGVSVFYFVFVC